VNDRYERSTIILYRVDGCSALTKESSEWRFFWLADL